MPCFKVDPGWKWMQHRSLDLYVSRFHVYWKSLCVCSVISHRSLDLCVSRSHVYWKSLCVGMLQFSFFWKTIVSLCKRQKKENETIVFKNDFFCKKLAVSLTIVNDDPSLTIAERRRLETALKDIGIRCMSFFQLRLFVNDR